MDEHLPHEDVLPDVTLATGNVACLPQSHCQTTRLCERAWTSMGSSMRSLPYVANFHWSALTTPHLPQLRACPDAYDFHGLAVVFPHSQTKLTRREDPFVGMS
jgi:hypothetical protein